MNLLNEIYAKDSRQDLSWVGGGSSCRRGGATGWMEGIDGRVFVECVWVFFGGTVRLWVYWNVLEYICYAVHREDGFKLHLIQISLACYLVPTGR